MILILAWVIKGMILFTKLMKDALPLCDQRLTMRCSRLRRSGYSSNLAPGWRVESTWTSDPTSSMRPCCRASWPLKTSPEKVRSLALSLFPRCFLTSAMNLACEFWQICSRYFLCSGESSS